MLDIQANVPLAPLTTFKIGGNASYFVEVKNEEEIREALAWARERGLQFFILGGGSNLLIADTGFAGLVIKASLAGLRSIEVEKGLLCAESGYGLLDLMKMAGERGMGGWEKLAGIPGTIGGAVRGNAGAFGSEIKDFVVSVRAIDTGNGQVREFSNAECEFAYRQSFFKSHPRFFLTAITLQLSPLESQESARLREETITEREKRHLQNVQAAGSYFTNPVAPKEVQELFEKEKGVEAREGRVPAGWLIEKVGLKGAVEGGAMASLQHPNYLVNMGSATAAQVRELAERIKAAVNEKFGIELEEEAAIF